MSLQDLLYHFGAYSLISLRQQNGMYGEFPIAGSRSHKKLANMNF